MVCWKFGEAPDALLLLFRYDQQIGAALLALHAMACDSSGAGGGAGASAGGGTALKDHDFYRPAFVSAIRVARADVVGSLAAASMESYHR